MLFSIKCWECVVMKLWFGNITMHSVHVQSLLSIIDWTLDATHYNRLFADNECEEACVHGLCGDACQTTSDCADGNQCQKNECIMPCTDRLSCPPLQICVQGYCTTNCKACSTTLSTNLALTHPYNGTRPIAFKNRYISHLF